MLCARPAPIHPAKATHAVTAPKRMTPVLGGDPEVEVEVQVRERRERRARSKKEVFGSVVVMLDDGAQKVSCQFSTPQFIPESVRILSYLGDP